MARIVINTLGSTGDLFPFIALGQALRDRGHSVIFAVSITMHPTLKKAGLDCVNCGMSIGEEEAVKQLEIFEGNRPFNQLKLLMLKWLIPSTELSYHALMDACKGADVLVAASIQFAASMVQEKLGLHWVTAALTPAQFETAHEPPLRFPVTGLNFMNRLGWAMTKSIVRRSFLPPLNNLRVKLGFRPESSAPSLDNFSRELALLASSTHFSPSRPDWPSTLKQTGYWFYDGKDQTEWQPSPQLKEFVSKDQKPIVLSLGSMVQKNPQRVVEIHAEAAARLKQRLIVQQGWGKLSVEGVKSLAPGDIIGAGFLPHQWLFSHAKAVIHHGGAGTTARSLRNGCPMLIEPHGFDQPYNARRIRQLGVGHSIDSHKVTVGRLEHALKIVLSDNAKQRISQIAANIQKEDGPAEACEHIENLLRSRSNTINTKLVAR